MCMKNFREPKAVECYGILIEGETAVDRQLGIAGQV